MTALLLALACAADVATWTPTPTYMWDHDGANTAGFRVYWRHADAPAGTWNGSYDLPVTPVVNEDTGAVVTMLPGVELGYPVQRAIPNEGYDVRFVIRAYSLTNEESLPSPEQALCMPLVWQPGEVWE